MVSSRVLLGIALFETNNDQDARRELTQALALNPKDLHAKLYLARSLLELGDLNGAVHLLEDLDRVEPQNAQILYTLGEAYMKLAAATLGRLQKTNPDSYLVEVLLGKSAEAKQAFEEAAVHYRKAIVEAPSAQGLHYLLGHCLWRDGKSLEALREFQRELQVNPYDYQAAWHAALVLLEQDPRQADRLATRALELKPDLPAALMVRGRALLALNKPKEAVQDFLKVVALDPEEDTAHFQLARAYRRLGLIQQAVTEDAIFARMESSAHSPKGKQAVLNRQDSLK
jgi:tetratricopeptide (TPR) repeat protein